MTQAQPPTSFDGAQQSMNDRLDNAFGSTAVDGPDGAPPPQSPVQPPPAEAPPVDIFSDEALDNLDFGNVPYRDGIALRGEIQKARDRFRPFNDAFGDLDDSQRQLLLDSAPSLGADLATLANSAAGLHPQDRAYFVEAMRVLAVDPQRGAQMLADGADAIRGATGGQPPAQPTGDDGYAASSASDPFYENPDEVPMTRAEFQQQMQQRDEQVRMERLQDEILNEVRGLGYDPEAQVGTAEYDSYSYLLALAGRPDIQGDLGKADAILKARDQQVIDAYVNGKTADAGRPAVPAIPGGVPASEQQELTTLEDAQAAMRGRLDAQLGPDPRRRL